MKKIHLYPALAFCTFFSTANAADKNMHEAYKYQIGGGSPIAQSSSSAINLGSVGAGVEWNSTMECGKFDINAAVTKSFGVSGNFRQTIDGLIGNATNAAAGLAGAALQRANPQLFETLMQGGKSAQFDLEAFGSSCESMQNAMLDMLPESTYTAMNFSEEFNNSVASIASAQFPDHDVFEAKQEVLKKVKQAGIKSITGDNKGGENQAAYEPIVEATIAGFNTLLGRSVSDQNSVNDAGSEVGSASGASAISASNSAIVSIPKDFQSPSDVSDFITKSFGSKKVSVCDGCASSSTMGAGITPELVKLTEKAKQDIDNVFAKSTVVGAANSITDADLAKVSQPPTIQITREVIYSLQQETASAQAAFKERMAAELATLRLFEKLAMARKVLYAGLYYPDLNSNEAAKETVKEQIEAIDSHIRMMRDEIEIRSMLASNVPMLLLERQSIRDTQGVSISTKGGLLNE